MKVQDLMSRDVKTCRQGSNLAEVASVLWENDCGALPVVDNENKVVGMISDRDICLAVATKGRLASEISVGEVIGGKPVYTCASGDDLQDALSIMQRQQIRRIPVLGKDGGIEGILSISDVLLGAESDLRGSKQGVSLNDAISTLKAICEQRHPAQNAAAASGGSAKQA